MQAFGALRAARTFYTLHAGYANRALRTGYAGHSWGAGRTLFAGGAGSARSASRAGGASRAGRALNIAHIFPAVRGFGPDKEITADEVRVTGASVGMRRNQFGFCLIAAQDCYASARGPSRSDWADWPNGALRAGFTNAGRARSASWAGWAGIPLRAGCPRVALQALWARRTSWAGRAG